MKHIEKLYDHLTYFDQYGASVLLLIFITICLILAMSYCYIMANIQNIKDDWTNQRCKPYIIPFAGIINAPKNSSILKFTSDNFNYCSQTILQSIMGNTLSPITFVTNMIQNIVGDLANAINDVRGMFDKLRNSIKGISQEIMGRIMNMMIRKDFHHQVL